MATNNSVSAGGNIGQSNQGIGGFFQNLGSQFAAIPGLLRQTGTTQDAQNQQKQAQQKLGQRVAQGNVQPAGWPGIISTFGAPGTTSGILSQIQGQSGQSTPSATSSTGAGASVSAPGSSSFYQMTPSEASGGQAGIDAYNKRVASGVSGQGGGATRGTDAGTGQTQQPVQPPVQPTQPSGGGTGGAQTFPGLVSGLAGLAGTQSPQYQVAQQQYQNAAQQLADLKTQAANAQFLGAGTNIAEYAGTQGLLANRLANQEQALTGEMQAAANAMGAATGQQQVQQTGLGAAAGLGAPTPASALGFYQPLSGQTQPYGGGPGGAFGAGEIGGNVALGQQYSQTLLPAYNAAGAILNDPQNGMDSFLQSHPEINPDKLRVGNQLQQWVQGQMSDPDLATFNQKLNEFLSTATPLVGAMGGMTNFKQSMVNSMLDGMAQGQSVSQAMHTMYDLMGAKLRAIAQSGGATMGTTGANTQTQSNATGGPDYKF